MKKSVTTLSINVDSRKVRQRKSIRPLNINKPVKSITVTLLLSASLFCFHASAQQEGIPSYTISGNGTLTGVVGFATNGAGFAFSPNLPIAVTALGFGGSDLANSPYTVSLFNSTGNLLASVQVNTGSTFYNQTYYQDITALNLTQGNTYYIGAEESRGGPSYWLGNVVGGSDGGTFSVNPDISYLNSETGFMPPGTVPSSPGAGASTYFFVDENFKFTVVPEPSAFSLLVAGATLLLAYRRKLFGKHEEV